MMIAPREGQEVSYVGDPTAELNIGDKGRILVEAGDGSHVIWITGARKDRVDLVHNLDIVVNAVTTSELDDSLETGMVTFAVREVYETEGEAGLLNALNAEGSLAGFSRIAQSARHHIATQLRQDALMRQVMGELETDEAEDLINLATTVLIRDVLR